MKHLIFVLAAVLLAGVAYVAPGLGSYATVDFGTTTQNVSSSTTVATSSVSTLVKGKIKEDAKAVIHINVDAEDDATAQTVAIQGSNITGEWETLASYTLTGDTDTVVTFTNLPLDLRITHTAGDTTTMKAVLKLAPQN